MKTTYKTFHLITSSDGILLVSKKSTDHPFIIVNNDLLGLVIFHAGEENYSARLEVKNMELLDFTCMTTYYTVVQDSSHWAVSIPYRGRIINPKALFGFSEISTHKCFSADDFPNRFNAYKNLAVITGIQE
jgi:hypothetical protein